MAPEKVTEMVLHVDLKCSGCYKKVKKVLSKIPQIRDQVFDVEKNKVKVNVVCCSPEKIRDKLCYKGGGSIQSIEIVEKTPAAAPDKPKDPEKPKPSSDKPKEPEKPKPAADKPKEPEKPKPAADKPKEPEKTKAAADKPKEAEKPKPATDKPKAAEKPKEAEKPKPAADKPKEQEKAKAAADKPKEAEKPKPATDKPKDAGKETEKAKPVDKPKDLEQPPAPGPDNAKPKDAGKAKEADKPSAPKEAPTKPDMGPNQDIAKMVYEPIQGYPQMYPPLAYPVMGYGQYYDQGYGGAPFQHAYGMPVAPSPPRYNGFGYEYGYNGNMNHYTSNDYGGEEDGEGCSIM